MERTELLNLKTTRFNPLGALGTKVTNQPLQQTPVDTLEQDILPFFMFLNVKCLQNM